MKKIFFLILIYIVSIGIVGCSLFSPGYSTFDIPDPEYWELDNGLRIMLYPDEELPIVAGKLFFEGGRYWETEKNRGIYEALGAQLREGGAGEFSADDLDKKLETLAAGISTSFSNEYGVIGFSGLKSDYKTILALVSDVVLRPRFEEKRYEIWKGQRIESIQRRKDAPMRIASIAFRQLIYAGSRYGDIPLIKDVEGISRSDLVREHVNALVPDRALLAITGSVSRSELEPVIEELFADDWEPSGQQLKPLPSLQTTAAPGIYFIEMPLTQSSIIFGHPGPERFPEDYPAIRSFNELFGEGAFSAELMKKIRTELALAYSVYGSVQFERVAGRSIVMMQTKSESTGRALQESLKIIDRFRTHPVPQKDLKDVYQRVSNSFIFRFESPDLILERKALHNLLGFPKDYDTTYLPKLSRVDSGDVRRVAQKYWHPEKLILVVVGSEKAYSQLESLINEPEGFLSGYSLQKLKFEENLGMEGVETVSWSIKQ